MAKVEGISWQCQIKADEIGDALEYTKHPVSTTITDFTLSCSMVDLEPWAQKAKSWFIDGRCLEQDEMTVAITLLAPDRVEELGTITLLNCGFKEFEAQPKMEAEGGEIARFKVKMYAEQCKFMPIYTDA